jgi:hypothetical protein
MILISAFGFTQNQSITGVQPFISNPIGPQFGGQEIFRFQPGLVTQLGAGSTSFNFNQKWFSFGELNTGTQMVYGLRFQLPNRAITLGYQDTSDINPRLQWIGEDNGVGDMEFRFANSFGSTISDLVATMRNDTGTVFAQNNLTDFNDAKVGIFSEAFDKAMEIILELSSQNRTFGVDVLNNSEAPQNYGYRSIVQGSATSNFGFNTQVTGIAAENYGLQSFVAGSATNRYGVQARVVGTGDINFGVIGTAFDASVNYGIYGIVPTNGIGASLNPGDFGGFFEGDIGSTGGFFALSDKRFKENIRDLEYPTENLLALKPKIYNYIKSDKINLSQGNQYGFIAQELEQVFPELIKDVKKPVFDENGNIVEYLEYKSVNYIPLIAVLTASIQELSQEVEQLKATNNTYMVYSDRLTSEEKKRLESMAYKLEQNYPNPFNGKSIIEYSLPEDEQNASIMIFDLTGGLLKTINLQDKSGQIVISSDEFKPGMYLYSLVVRNDEIMTKKMIVQ